MNDVFLIDVMYAAVAQREGLPTAVAHATEQTREEFVHYFDKHYQVFAQDVPMDILMDRALDMFDGPDVFVAMLKQNRMTDIIECLMREGYLTQLARHWVLSVDKPHIT